MVIPTFPETRMSKRLRNSEVCADCSNSDPRWASVNRGVLICDECCGVHRSLGRHNSQVRHLSNTPWPPTQLQMVQTLYNNGANAIWEHTLLDPSSITSGKRKPNPQDKVHPNKTEFIKSKYQMLAFVHRLPCRDDDSTAAADLSKQLHSSVRTGNLETCLRLLSLGAQANYFHPEKGNTPLHIAAKAGQVCQAELLCVYGADPGAPDSNGKTPIHYARQAGHQDLADRLVEIQYELTDRLAFYLCGRKPDHKNRQHFIIPQMADRSLELTEFAKAAKRKLQSLSDHLFEELAMDVYDEVDRRETDAVWLATQNHSTLVTETTVVPFLPVNPEYSSTRNQGRQKLARFNAHEFATLVIDILSDAKRRQLGNSVSSPKDNVEVFFKSMGSRHGSESQEIDQPDYDSVASDEDTDTDLRVGKADRAKSLDSDQSDGPISVQEFLEVKNALSASEAKIQELMKANSNLSEELRLMQKKASRFDKQSSVSDGDYDNTVNESDLDDSGFGRRFRLRSSGWMGESGSIPELDDHECEPDPSLPSTEDVIRKTEQITKNIQELLRAAQENKHESAPCEQRESVRRLRHSLGCFSTLVPWADKPPSPMQSLGLRAPHPANPNNPASCFIPCAERIHVAVNEMAALFPKRPRSETVRSSLRLLTSSANRLQNECKKASPLESSPAADVQLVTQQVIQCAYDIAKAAKQLVTITTKENN
ncbi:ARF GTPase-activating protein GIT2a isoform X4 [Onychostoma macrolepis]|uniref:ARF GTPase-activating protein GIT2a isoform X4 n=1 Tax=Onychostoma macrolepis TaxID=369639 RepID=UPI00272ADBFF|nr:ARF GTPase-activating protein GIT2a isoform X4 [Onychostoma macrolepis]